MFQSMLVQEYYQLSLLGKILCIALLTKNGLLLIIRLNSPITTLNIKSVVKSSLILIPFGQTCFANNYHYIISMTIPQFAFAILEKTSLTGSIYAQANIWW